MVVDWNTLSLYPPPSLATWQGQRDYDLLNFVGGQPDYLSCHQFALDHSLCAVRVKVNETRPFDAFQVLAQAVTVFRRDLFCICKLSAVPFLTLVVLYMLGERSFGLSSEPVVISAIAYAAYFLTCCLYVVIWVRCSRLVVLGESSRRWWLLTWSSHETRFLKVMVQWSILTYGLSFVLMGLVLVAMFSVTPWKDDGLLGHPEVLAVLPTAHFILSFVTGAIYCLALPAAAANRDHQFGTAARLFAQSRVGILTVLLPPYTLALVLVTYTRELSSVGLLLLVVPLILHAIVVSLAYHAIVEEKSA